MENSIFNVGIMKTILIDINYAPLDLIRVNEGCVHMISEQIQQVTDITRSAPFLEYFFMILETVKMPRTSSL